MTPLTERGRIIQSVIANHYPSAYECDLCGTHLECPCNEVDSRDTDTWTTEHLARKVDEAL